MTYFTILNSSVRNFSRFNASGKLLRVKFNNPVENENPVTFFKTAMEHLFEEILQNFSDSDMVGL